MRKAHVHQLLAILSTASPNAAKLDVIDLPVGFYPEGITLGDRWTAYVGSMRDGSIWKGDLLTGQGEVKVSDAGGAAVGLEHDGRSGYLYVCGGGNGTVRIYDTNTPDFDLVADIQLAGGENTSFVNDVIVTKRAAYLTDSTLYQLYALPLDEGSGRLAHGHETLAEIISLNAEFSRIDGWPRANGIEVTDSGDKLIVAHMLAGELYTVDPGTGNASLIDLGGASIIGDGLVLRKNTLWVVEHTYFGGTSRIAEIALSEDLTCGTVVRNLTSDSLDDPATAIHKGNSLYAVNSKFWVSDEDVADTEYEIIRLDRDGTGGTCSA